jgi:hypothetical protein
MACGVCARSTRRAASLPARAALNLFGDKVDPKVRAAAVRNVAVALDADSPIRSRMDPERTIGPRLDSAPDAPCVHGFGFFNDSVDGLTTCGPPKKKSGPRPAPAMDSGRNDPARGTRAEADTTAGP